VVVPHIEEAKSSRPLLARLMLEGNLGKESPEGQKVHIWISLDEEDCARKKTLKAAAKKF